MSSDSEQSVGGNFKDTVAHIGAHLDVSDRGLQHEQAPDEEDDLFGDDASKNGDVANVRTLDDEELDSGDDEERDDRGQADDLNNEDELLLTSGDFVLSRVQIPESSDGEFYTLAIPDFLKIQPENFLPSAYDAPPFATASQSIYWRHDPKIQDKLQSNARVLRWSDGSLTLQLASNAKMQYRLSAKPLAAPSMGSLKLGSYDPEKDAHMYMGTVLETAGLIRIGSHLTTSLTVLPTNTETDEAVLRLQESMAAATQNAKIDSKGKVRTIEINEDPDLAKKKAELAERDRMRAQRKRQAAADRESDRIRGAGLTPRGATSGLSLGGLEGHIDKPRSRASRKPKRPSNRRGEIYTDDEDDSDRRGRTREDEYDEDDGFLVGSDEEPEIVEEEDEEEEEEEEEEDDADTNDRHRKAPRGDRATPKRSRPESNGLNGDEEKIGNKEPQRKKNRYIVDDDEEEDEKEDE